MIHDGEIDALSPHSDARVIPARADIQMWRHMASAFPLREVFNLFRTLRQAFLNNLDVVY